MILATPAAPTLETPLLVLRGYGLFVVGARRRRLFGRPGER
ncbi:MAG TPA: hypothetical protein VFZ91_07890 [Allosphingosinicella sp.]